jgi:hypothetical protein
MGQAALKFQQRGRTPCIGADGTMKPDLRRRWSACCCWRLPCRSFPRANGGGWSDESTYYLLAHSLARDLDFTYRREDLVRVWEEFTPGPQGIFLKKGKDIDIHGSSEFPFVQWTKREDPESGTRLYYSKSYIYPLAAAPFVYAFGTSGS